MRIFVSAAEASSDRHGAKLVRALREELGARGEKLEVFGVGGPELRSEGMRIVVDARELLSMGFSEILSRLPRILRALDEAECAVRESKPFVAVFLDYPDFHFRLARRLKGLRVPLVYYIPPKVWAWRSGRTRDLRELFHAVLCILPFESEFLLSKGVNARYVGNPLLDELPLSSTRAEARTNQGLPSNGKLLALLPGSRPAELKRHFVLFLEAALLIAREQPGLEACLVLPKSTERGPWEEVLRKWKSETGAVLPIRVSQGNSEWVLKACDFGIVKSGTSTLEAALLGLPHVVVYKPSLLTTFLVRKVIRYLGPVGLSNLVLDRMKETYPERLGLDATPAKIADALLRFPFDPTASERVVKRLLPPSGSPSLAAAREVLKAARAPMPASSVGVSRKMSFARWIGSFAWATANSLARVFWKMFPSQRLGARTISIGNIEAGGTGKTPLTIRIAREGIARGERVAVLLRGYGGAKSGTGGIFPPGRDRELDAGEWGDEAVLLSRALPEAWIGVGKDRMAIAERIRESSEALKHPFPSLFLLDDGFQKFRIHRDLDVIARTSARPGEAWFRDFACAIPQDALLLWTKGVREPQKPRAPDLRILFEVENAPLARKIFLVSGTGNPSELERSIVEAGFEVQEHRIFADHHPYSRAEIENLLALAKSRGLSIATTGKDAVKWEKEMHPSTLASLGIQVLEPKLKLQGEEGKWNRALWGS